MNLRRYSQPTAVSKAGNSLAAGSIVSVSTLLTPGPNRDISIAFQVLGADLAEL